MLGTVAAGISCVSVNVLVSRFYLRWDATSSQLYTLSPATERTLLKLDQPVEVVVFLSRSDPLIHSVATLLDSYRAKSARIRTRFVDPDQNPAEFISLQQRYGLFEGRTENGRMASEASIVLSSGKHHWFVTTDDLVVFDDENGLAKPRLEQAITEGIVNLLGRARITVCVTQGHHEPDLEDAGAQGLAEFRRELERNNLDVRAVDLSSPDPAETLDGCRLVVIAGPAIPFDSTAAERVRRELHSGASLFALVGPVSDDEGRIVDPGLDTALRDTGISFANDLVFEGDEKMRLPVGIGGEVFLATPLAHATTEAFFHHGEAREHVLMQLAQGVAIADTSSARPLLQSTEHAFHIQSFRTLQSGEPLPEAETAPRRELLAAAWEASAGAAGEASGQHSRVVVVGTPSVLWPSTFSDPGLLATRRFVENTVNWLVAAPTLVSVPEKRSQPAGLDLTEAAMSEVQRYVLLYLPLAVLCLGGLVVLRRRKELPDTPG
jgi:hypothetical protein